MDPPAKPAISQKDYLKKYFSKSKSDKVKKKKVKLSSSSHLKRSQIIDDDLNLNSMANIDDDEFNLAYLGDEAPQIAGIVDERPDHVKIMEQYGDSKVWKSVGEESNQMGSIISSKDSEKSSNMLSNNSLSNNGKKKDNPMVDSDESPPRKPVKSRDKEMNKNRESRPAKYFDNDNSPPRNRDNNKPNIKSRFDSDNSPPRKSIKNNQHRKELGYDRSPSRKFSKNNQHRKYSDSDNSPPRKSGRNDRHRKGSEGKQSPPRNFGKKEFDSDQSPPRKSGKYDRQRKNSDSDLSPPRKFGKNDRRRKNPDSDQSPPRKSSKNNTRRKDSDSDQSPPRKFGKNDRRRKDSDSDQSPPRNSSKNNKGRNNYDSDQSPPRNSGKYARRRKDSGSDQSPPRQSNFKDKHLTYANSKNRLNEDPSPQRKRHDKNESRDFTRKFVDHDRNRSSEPSKERLRNKNDAPTRSKDLGKNNPDLNKLSSLETTLEGKKAGLQDAKNLRNELASLREQEDLMFKNMDSGKYGAGQEAVVRDRKTGRIKDIAKEQQESKEKMKERQAREEKYSRWGKGLKQIEDASSKAASSRYEMSKPLARYKDDNDLDTYLKAQEREGDPMLDFIKKNQNESHSVTKLKPRYEGSYGPNRFNIRPGHRWDGVDRSNGYETKWFESINAKKAVQEEAWKWSSSDM